jgi:ABC-type polar amino acid transport system ATPase subunit
MTESRDAPIIRCRGVRKAFGAFEALRGIDLDVHKGEVIVIVGPSGSGKSTFIRSLNRLEPHDAGTIVVNGVELSEDLKVIESVRREIGMVFQQFNLFPHLTILENVTLAPLRVRRWPREKAQSVARALLKRVGIAEQAEKYPAQLSGGQQQRVAIARSLINNPSILLADEPTGNLDTRTSIEVMDIFQRLNRERGITVLLITHEHDIAEYGTRIVQFRDGLVVADRPVQRRRFAEAELAALPPQAAAG